MIELKRRDDFAIKGTDGTSDLRLGKVGYIKYAIEAGTYNVYSEEVASRMLIELLLDELTTKYRYEINSPTSRS